MIKAFQVKHNVICYGYSLKIRRGGRFFVEQALENQIPQKYWNRLQKGDTVSEGDVVYTPDMVIGPERRGIKLTYCTDSRPVKAIADNAEGSDLFICEGMYGENEKDTKAREYKHMTFCEAANLAKSAQVRELWLTHYSPSLIRPEDYIGEAKRIFHNVKPGKDRKSITLDFDKDE